MDIGKIGKLIKERREFLSLRQEDLSELSKINMRSIHQVENGSGNPSFGTLTKIADVLGLELLLTVRKTE